MIRIFYLGTCSGTEPFPGMHQCSLIIQIDGINYWFDAGENCAYAAHTGQISIMDTRTLFISHPHIDHVGGLPHLLFCIQKLIEREKCRLICDNTLEVFSSEPRILEAAKALCGCGNAEYNLRYQIRHRMLSQGEVYKDERIRVCAIPNQHMKRADGTIDPRSYSFCIEAEGKRIIYGGDIRYVNELDPFMDVPADLLIMETGHHAVADVCEYAIQKGAKRLRFNHHGREIIYHREDATALIQQYAKQSRISIRLCYDGMTETLE